MSRVPRKGRRKAATDQTAKAATSERSKPCSRCNLAAEVRGMRSELTALGEAIAYLIQAVTPGPTLKVMGRG